MEFCYLHFVCHCVLNSDVFSQDSVNGCPKLAIVKYLGAILFKRDFEKYVDDLRGDF